MDQHIWADKKSLTRSINTKTALIRNIKPYLTQQQLSVVGGALVNSAILYAAPIWGTTTQQNIDKVQKFQTRAARAITNRGWKKTGPKMHRQALFEKIGWQNTRQIITSSMLNLAKMAIDQKSSHTLNQLFNTTNPIHPRQGQGTRITHKGRIGQKGNTFATQAPQIYNQLPASIRNPIISGTKFKRELKMHIHTQHELQKH